MNIAFEEYQELLMDLIRIPSFSRREDKTAQVIFNFFAHKNIMASRHFNNVYMKNRHFDPAKPTWLLNSHHDTVQPGKDWKRDPFSPEVRGNRLYGLGSNDAGASLVCLLAAFIHYYDREDLTSNLVFVASAEEEVSGKDGIESVIPLLGDVEGGIIGEPTELKMAVAEKGLMVVDCKAHGKSGHAAREEGDNAIYKAMKDIQWINEYRFPKNSEYLGKVKMTVTMIQSGGQHNIIPDECTFVIDIRSTDKYRNEEIVQVLKENMESDFTPRSIRLQSTSISMDHSLVQAGRDLNIPLFGSSTLSDQALLNFPTVKIGPGDSARSHTADEYILLDELRDGIKVYIELINRLVLGRSLYNTE